MTFGKATVLALLSGLAMLFLVDPGSGWLPRCPVLCATGFDCPGCGSLRCMHSLLHGEIRQAWRYNALLICVAPVVLVGVLSEFTRFRALRLSRMRPWSVAALLVFIVAFGILRNVPGFEALRPHRMAPGTDEKRDASVDVCTRTGS